MRKEIVIEVLSVLIGKKNNNNNNKHFTLFIYLFFRHEMPDDPDKNPLAKQNMKDRYYGKNDPVALKILRKTGVDVDEGEANNEGGEGEGDGEKKTKKLMVQAPEDKSITTLWVGAITGRTEENEIRDAFFEFGEIKNLKYIREKHCAFVTFSTRGSAERCMEKLVNMVLINGKECKLKWGKPPRTRQQNAKGVMVGGQMPSAAPPLAAFAPPQFHSSGPIPPLQQ